jgi:hypothetical protein
MNEVIFLLEENNACEFNYTYGIINILNKYISDYSIIVTADFMSLPPTKYKKIVILAGELSYNTGTDIYTSYSDVVAVFRFYCASWHYDNKRIFPIHCGYNRTSNGTFMVKMYPEKKISERKYDLFYSGQKLDHRKVLVGRLDELKNSFNVFSQVNPMFRLGLDIDDYYKFLGDSKICVVPDGTSVDTYRFTEACGSGCAVITTPKPDLWYYHNAPVFYVNNWDELTKEFINEVLSWDLDNIQISTLKYYNDCLSEEAVAKYILTTLQCLK